LSLPDTNARSKEIVDHLKIIKGEEFVWHIYDGKNDRNVKTFILDIEAPEDFISFYNQMTEMVLNHL
jgi:hypothetical protein